MPNLLNYGTREALISTLRAAFWSRHAFFDFLKTCKVPESAITGDRQRPKVHIAREMVGNLEQMGESGEDALRRILTELQKMREPPDWTMTPEQRAEGTIALDALRTAVADSDSAVKEERRTVAVITDAKVKTQDRPYEQVRIEVHQAFLDAYGDASNPQERGRLLERLFGQLLAAAGIDYHPPYASTGEQIDGAFKLDSFDYILEIRWRREKAESSDLDVLAGKVSRKLSSTRGLFVSIAGSSANAATNHSSGSSLVLLDGADLMLILEGHVGVAEAIRAKTSWAARTGASYRPLCDLLV